MPSSYVPSHLPSRHWVNYVLFPIFHPQTAFHSSTFFSQHCQRVVEKSYRRDSHSWGQIPSISVTFFIKQHYCLMKSIHTSITPTTHHNTHMSTRPKYWTHHWLSYPIKDSFLMFLMHIIPMCLPLSCPFAPKGKNHPWIKTNLILIFFCSLGYFTPSTSLPGPQYYSCVSYLLTSALWPLQSCSEPCLVL